MNMKPQLDFRPCVPGAFHGGLTRTAFFDGMVLSEADMLREQNYWAMKRKLTNRALGRGVVWGLDLQWDEKSRCFTLCPGYGLSCCGDDLIVECPETVCEGELIDPCSEAFRRLFADKADPCKCDPDPKGPVEACLYLEYVECPEDPRRVFEDPCAQSPQGCRYGAIRETTRLTLVPPPCPEPPGPIERFCGKIAEIRAALAKEGVEMPPAFLGSAPAAGIAIGSHDANKNPVNAEAQLDLVPETAESVAISDLGDNAVTLKVTPPPGYVFTSVKYNGNDATGAETMMGVSFKHASSELANNDGVRITVKLEITPLLGTADAIVATLKLHATVAGGLATMQATVGESERVTRRADCFAVFADGFLLQSGDAACILRTLVLAVVTGWFNGLLGNPACAPERAREEDRTRLILAWLIAWLAWYILFRIDIRDERAAGAIRCLQALFREWCCGMHYKGPRCDSHQHGIFLGCVMVSRDGRIKHFDEWKHRRYVLTGPLINHWGSQFGLAPVDVVATRLASWICCVAGVELPRIAQAGLDRAGSRYTIFGSSLAGYGAAAGSKIDDQEILNTAKVSAMEFARVLLHRFRTNVVATPAEVSGYDVFRSRDLGLEIAVPAAGRRQERTGERPVAEVSVAPVLAELPPMTHQPAVDFVNRFGGTITLGELRTPKTAEGFAPMVAALEKAEIVTLADLVELGPERAIAKARPAIAENTDLSVPGAAEVAMNHVYRGALDALGAVATTIASEAKERSDDEPFVRADLEQSATLAAVRTEVNKTLKGRGITPARLRTIAAEAVALRP